MVLKNTDNPFAGWTLEPQKGVPLDDSPGRITIEPQTGEALGGDAHGLVTLELRAEISKLEPYKRQVGGAALERQLQDVTAKVEALLAKPQEADVRSLSGQGIPPELYPFAEQLMRDRMKQAGEDPDQSPQQRAQEREAFRQQLSAIFGAILGLSLGGLGLGNAAEQSAQEQRPDFLQVTQDGVQTQLNTAVGDMDKHQRARHASASDLQQMDQEATNAHFSGFTHNPFGFRITGLSSAASRHARHAGYTLLANTSDFFNLGPEVNARNLEWALDTGPGHSIRGLGAHARAVETIRGLVG